MNERTMPTIIFKQISTNHPPKSPPFLVPGLRWILPLRATTITVHLCSNGEIKNGGFLNHMKIP